LLLLMLLLMLLACAAGARRQLLQVTAIMALLRRILHLKCVNARATVLDDLVADPAASNPGKDH
jgi:hypothetical protein